MLVIKIELIINNFLLIINLLLIKNIKKTDMHIKIPTFCFEKNKNPKNKNKTE